MINLSLLLRYPLDKIKFLSLSGSIRGEFQRSTLLLSILLLLSALAGLFHFPTGAVWLLPPLGPIICWPCETFSRTETAEGVCLPDLEPAGCVDASGAPIDQGSLLALLSPLWQTQPPAGTQAAAAAAAAATAAAEWLADNDHLFSSRR